MENKIETKAKILREKYFPLKLPMGCLARVCTEKEMREIMQKIFGNVFAHSEDTYRKVPKERKEIILEIAENYLNNIHGEFFIFENSEGMPIGWFMGEQEDHMTFYLRNSGVIPEYRRHGGATFFLTTFLQYLQELGYERVTSQHKPTNAAILIAELKLGFHIAGMEFTERWGTLVKLVKFLHEYRNENFVDRFGDLDHKPNVLSRPKVLSLSSSKKEASEFISIYPGDSLQIERAALEDGPGWFFCKTSKQEEIKVHEAFFVKTSHLSAQVSRTYTNQEFDFEEGEIFEVLGEYSHYYWAKNQKSELGWIKKSKVKFLTSKS